MNISALLVFSFAVMAAYGYMEVPCTDCSNPCSPHRLREVEHNITERMKISWTFCTKYNNISNNANPSWKCKATKYETNRTPRTYQEAHCGKCKDKYEVAQPIKQDVIMFSRQNCPNPNESKLVLEVKQVTLGCTCVKFRHRK